MPSTPHAPIPPVIGLAGIFQEVCPKIKRHTIISKEAPK